MLTERKVMNEYTGRIDGFQIRDMIYLEDPPKDEIAFDIVKWAKYDSPKAIYDVCEKRVITTDEYCYSVARLVWNPKEPCFEFQSVGMRWLECNPTEKIIVAIRAFADHKAKEILENVEAD